MHGLAPIEQHRDAAVGPLKLEYARELVVLEVGQHLLEFLALPDFVKKASRTISLDLKKGGGSTPPPPLPKTEG